MADIKIITHIDFDGIFSGAILLNELKQKNIIADLILAIPKYLDKPFQELCSSFSKIKQIYIADLSLNENLIEQIEPSLDTLKKQGTEIFWYDHHQWTPSALATARKYCSELLVITKYKTAAELMVVEKQFSSEYSKKLIRTIKSQYANKEEEKWGEEWKYFLNAIGNENINFTEIENSIKKLAANKQFNFFEKLKIKRIAKLKDKISNFINKEHRIETTEKNHKFVIVDLREAKNMNQMVSRDIANAKNVDFYVSVLDNNRLQIGRGKNYKINFKPLLELKEYKGIKYSIKGHSYVVAVYFTPGFFSILKSIFTGKLNTEIETIIDLLKERY